LRDAGEHRRDDIVIAPIATVRTPQPLDSLDRFLIEADIEHTLIGQLAQREDESGRT
jgi:hypothetical protein